MSLPLFPKLTPRIVDSAWFSIDQPCDDESEIAEMEHEHQIWLNSIAQKNIDLAPIGKVALETLEDDEEEDDEDDNDDDESESHDEEDEDEIEMDESQGGASPLDVSIPMVQGHGVR